MSDEKTPAEQMDELMRQPWPRNPDGRPTVIYDVTKLDETTEKRAPTPAELNAAFAHVPEGYRPEFCEGCSALNSLVDGECRECGWSVAPPKGGLLDGPQGKAFAKAYIEDLKKQAEGEPPNDVPSFPVPEFLKGATYNPKLGLYEKPNPDMLDGYERFRVTVMGPGGVTKTLPPSIPWTVQGAPDVTNPTAESASVNIPDMQMVDQPPKPERKLEVDRPLIQQAMEAAFQDAHDASSFFGCNTLVIVIDSQGNYQFKFQGIEKQRLLDLLLKVTTQINAMTAPSEVVKE